MKDNQINLRSNAHVRSLLLSSAVLALIIAGKNSGVIKMLQIVFAKIIEAAWIRVPFSCPSIAPTTKNKNKAKAEAKLINTINIIGESVTSPILSLLTENRYPIAVKTNAHWPNGVSAAADKSIIKPPIKPKTKAPFLSSRDSKTINAARYKEKPLIGKFMREITVS